MAKPAGSPETYRYAPDRLPGLLIQIPLALFLAAISYFGFRYFSQQEPGTAFFFSFILSVLFLIPVGFAFYRCYALINGSYTLARDSLTLRWGLRREIIPLSEINWIRTPDDIQEDIPWTFLPMPGAYSGKVTTESGERIEMTASNLRKMLFVGTTNGMFGISPEKPQEFLEGFQRVLQMGTVTEPPRQTIKPVDWIASSWNNRTARMSLLYSAVFLVILSLWIGFRFSGSQGVEVEFTTEGFARQTLPAQNVFILPLLGLGIWLVNLVVGVYLNKNERLRAIAEMVWGGSAVVLCLIMIAGFLIF